MNRKTEDACGQILDPKKKSKCRKHFIWSLKLKVAKKELSSCNRDHKPKLCKSHWNRKIETAKQKVKQFQ